jgi:hypothetical protein
MPRDRAGATIARAAAGRVATPDNDSIVTTVTRLKPPVD